MQKANFSLLWLALFYVYDATILVGFEAGLFYDVVKIANAANTSTADPEATAIPVPRYVGRSMSSSKYLTESAPFSPRPTNGSAKAATSRNIATIPYSSGVRYFVRTGRSRKGMARLMSCDAV